MQFEVARFQKSKYSSTYVMWYVYHNIRIWEILLYLLKVNSSEKKKNDTTWLEINCFEKFITL